MLGEYHQWKHSISTAALITNIPLTAWGNEMKFTEKIEKELIYSNNQNL
jgi:cyanate permease